MKLTATIKLQPSDDQRQRLSETLARANAACNWISQQAWQAKSFGRVPVHRLTYAAVRSDFDLAAQLAVRCIGKVVDAYRLDKKTIRQFKTLGAVPYDSRILNVRLHSSTVSIWLLGGRDTIPFVTGEHQRALLQYQRGESDLVYRRGEFYLYTTCDVPDKAEIDPEGWLGVDLGIANIATDSDGTMHQGKSVEKVRYRHRRLRTALQAAQTDSARRHLKRLSGKERRFATDVNHRISKRIVETAQGTTRGIALEDLTRIRERITARKARRATLHSWSFAQLRCFVEYKAQRAGIPLVRVDPRNTSRTCPQCGCIDKANRRSQRSFSCIQCGCAGHADYFAALEISRRAAVNRPIVGSTADERRIDL
jgi:putative transposase